MKKILAVLLILACILGLLGCGRGEARVVRTFDAFTDRDVFVTYNEMSDGTWQAGEHTYRYRLELTGRLNNAKVDSTYVVLSNTKDITFEQAWKASGLSSDLNDYFKPEDALVVGLEME